jgi:ectoine hydroxylase-related dioxygenase (phytanoyl-CoA dioxygenase family)
MQSTSPLRAEQVTAFQTAGYLVLPRLFDDDELDAMRRAADRILELAINGSLALQRRYPRMDAKLQDDGQLTLRKIQPVNDLEPAIAAISADERLLAPMRQLMDDEPVLMEEKLNYKQTVDTRGLDLGFLRGSSFNAAHSREGFVLHHDWGYYRREGYPENTLSSAVALDDCAGRGPIRVIPGSHLVDAPLADPDPASGSGIVADGFFDLADLTPVDAPAGSVMLFHAKLVHDSEPNRSGLPRRVMIYSHFPRSHDPSEDPDRRNGPIRVYAQGFETRYREAIERGDYTDLFHADWGN